MATHGKTTANDIIAKNAGEELKSPAVDAACVENAPTSLAGAGVDGIGNGEVVGIPDGYWKSVISVIVGLIDSVVASG